MKKVKQYDYIRVFVTLLVVMGHCTYFEIQTKYGGCNYIQYANNLSIAFKLVREVSAIIYLFHMQLFMALSGALFYITYAKGITLKQLVYKKMQRLLIPFIIVTLCYAVPLKYISGYYDKSQIIIRDVIVGQLFIQGNTHLWFLLVLFLIFIEVYFVEKYFKKSMAIKLVLFGIASVMAGKVDIVVVSACLRYTLWFYTGFCFEKHREKIDEKINTPFLLKTIGIMVVTYVILYCCRLKSDNYIYKCVIDIDEIVLTSAMCLGVYAVSVMLSRKNMIKGKLYDLLLRDSFGIYLYSDSWNYLVLLWGTGLFGKAIFASNIGATLFYVGRFLVTLVNSIVITELIRKCKWLKYLY